MDSRIVQQHIVTDVVGPRCAELAIDTAPALLASLMKDISSGYCPIKSMAATNMAFVSFLFKRGIIVFKEPVKQPEEVDDAV